MRKFLLIVFLVVNCKVFAQTLTSGGKLKPEQAIKDVRHYTIALDLDFAKKTMDGSATIDVIMSQPTKVLLFDLLDSLNLSQVLVNNKKEPFEYKDNLIRINLTSE